MSMSATVSAILSEDETFKKMKAAYDACMEAGVPVPDDVYSFFGGHIPDDNGPEVNVHNTVKKVEGRGCLNYYVDLSELPENTKTFKFKMGW